MSLKDALSSQLTKLTAALDILKSLESETRVLLGDTEPVIPVAGLDVGPEELMGELARMIDDEDLWDRRREEHIKYSGNEGDSRATSESQAATSENENAAESKEGESQAATSENENAAECKDDGDAAESQAPRAQGPTIPHINALTKLLPEDQDRVLYGIYTDAVHAVKTTLGGAIDFDNPEHDKLISDTSNKFLKLWLDANTV